MQCVDFRERRQAKDAEAVRLPPHQRFVVGREACLSRVGQHDHLFSRGDVPELSHAVIGTAGQQRASIRRKERRMRSREMARDCRHRFFAGSDVP